MIATAQMTADDFKAAANAMRRVIPARNTIPILDEALVSISAGKISFCGTNLDQQVTMEFEAETQGKATFTLSAQHLFGFAGATQGQVQINLAEPDVGAVIQNRVVTLQAAGIKLRLVDPHDAADFPKMAVTKRQPKPGDVTTFSASQDALARALTLGRHCISAGEVRYYLDGAFLTQKPNGKTLRVVTTDGHRMALVDTDIEAPKEVGILPSDGVDLIRSHLCAGANEPVTIQLRDNHLIFATSGFELVTKLIDGTYPDYMRAIPEPSDEGRFRISQAVIQRTSRLQRAIQRYRSPACEIDLTAGEMKIASPEGETATAPIESKGDFKIGINFKFLREQSRVTPDFTAQCAGPGEPMRFFGGDPDALFIIMPMRV